MSLPVHIKFDRYSLVRVATMTVAMIVAMTVTVVTVAVIMGLTVATLSTALDGGGEEGRGTRRARCLGGYVEMILLLRAIR
jgi:hypothetical protein